KIEDYSNYFGPDSPFLTDYDWEAFMVFDDQEVVAKAILTWRHGSSTGNLGFIDWNNNQDAADCLMTAIEVSARKNHLKTLKTPVDMNCYVRYRIRLPGGGSPVWGEPVYPEYYHELFKNTGFREIGRWDTYELDKFQG